MPKKPRHPQVEVLAESADALRLLTERVNIMLVTLNTLVADWVLVDPAAKQRLLITMQAVRGHPATPAELQQAYDRAIDIIESLRTRNI